MFDLKIHVNSLKGLFALNGGGLFTKIWILKQMASVFLNTPYKKLQNDE